MKKAILVSLMLCTLLLSAAHCETDDQIIFTASALPYSLSKWYARGEKTNAETVGSSLLITECHGAADCAAVELPMEGVKLYRFYAEILQYSASSVNFTMAIEHKTRNTVNRTVLGSTKAYNGHWTIITGQWLADTSGTCTLTIAPTDEKTDINFSVSNVSITEAGPFGLTDAQYEGELPSLSKLCFGLFDIGPCVFRLDIRDAEKSALILSQYNIITPGNELKPDDVLNIPASRTLAKEDETAVVVRFNAAAPILNFARDNGLKVHGHVLVWHEATPEEFFHVGYDTDQPYVSREVMLGRLENYIRQIFAYMDKYYPGLFASWDVVNESIDNYSSSLRESNWTRVIGEDYVERAFEIADRYAPEDVMLYYNDFGTPYEPKLTGIVNLLTRLVKEGHIDGYGFQSHYDCNSPSFNLLKKAFDRISSLGLRLRISELDVNVFADTDITRRAQARQYANLMSLYKQYADVIDAVQIWGIMDRTKPMEEAPVIIFDQFLKPKPAFFSIVDVLKADTGNTASKPADICVTAHMQQLYTQQQMISDRLPVWAESK